MKKTVLTIITIVFFFLLNNASYATTFTVTSTSDNSGIDPNPGDGTGTLRQAIIDAIDAGGTNTINFSITGTGPHTITLLSLLPSFSNITINGFSQTGATANTAIVFAGTTLNSNYKIIIKSGTSGANTLFELGSSNVIKGIVFEDCASAGTLITVNGSSNQIAGCFIGMQSNGTNKGAGNATIGVKINNVANNVIGDGTLAGVNLISGMSNYGTGILITGTSATGNAIKGNIIGLQKNGTTFVSANYQLYGIHITSGAGNNTIGGTGTYDGNVISGQYGQYGTGTKKYGIGVLLNSTATAGNTVIGNRIGMQSNGTTVVASNTQYVGIEILNSKNNTIGGNSSAYRNVISGNGPIPYQSQIWGCGILVVGSTSTGNAIKGNYIGPQSTGTAYITNAIQFKGIIFRSAGTGNTVGGSNSGEGNVISGNTCNFGGSCGEGRGIVIENTSSLTITGNIIGLQADGNTLLTNAPTEKQYWGIEIDSASTNNVIGGTTSTTRNIISGNSNTGIKIGFLNPSGTTGNTIKGNYIGLKGNGSSLVSGNIQGYGIGISGAGSNTIGGSNTGEGNVISGNVYFGIALSSSANGNTIWGNTIGASSTGTWITSNTQTRGINCEDSNNNNIGGNTSGKRNIISANEETGILVSGTSSGNLIKGNYIGSNSSLASITSATQDIGIKITAANNTIGGTSTGEENTIAFNTVNGISILGTSATGNKITRNLIYTNTGKGINLNYGATAGNNGKLPPGITALSNTVVSGTGINGDVIEVFKKPKTDCLDAKVYLGTATVSGGVWSLTISINTTIENVLVTATDASNNTSEFTADTPGQSIWTGAINTDWFNAANWNVCGSGVPTATVDAIIPNGTTNKPSVNNNNANCKRLIVEGDATVEVQGNYVITVYDN